MTNSSFCCNTELESRQAHPSMKVDLFRESEDPADPGIIADQDIMSFLRLVSGNSLDSYWEILLR